MKKRQTQVFQFWSNFDHPFPPEDGRNRKKIKSSGEKLQPFGLCKYVKIKAMPPFLSGKTRLLFEIFGLLLQENRVGSQI